MLREKSLAVSSSKEKEASPRVSLRTHSLASALHVGLQDEKRIRKEGYEESANVADTMSPPELIPDSERCIQFNILLYVTLYGLSLVEAAVI